jgi:hypothetical protein
MSEQELTFGQKACGVGFNPGQDKGVALIKEKYADIVDLLHDLLIHTDNGEVKRMLSIAITETQTAQMWAVKAVTWNK